MSDVTDRTPVRALRAVGGGLVIAVLGGGLLAGCQGDTPPHSQPAQHSSTASTDASPSASGPPSSTRPTSTPTMGGPTGTVPPSASSPPADTKVKTLHGTVDSGVEPGCLILKTSSGQYELVGADQKDLRTLRAGGKVTVRGYRERGMMSHCMQGPMIKVVSAHAAH